MLLKKAAHPIQDTTVAPELTIVEKSAGDADTLKAELRRQLYERIARGNALAKAEEDARRTWQG